nr:MULTISPECIES: diguanylate cyclase [unclassified Aeromonas]
MGRYLAGQRDLVASRFGGEEFVLLLPERDPLAQQARCEQIRQGIETLGLKGVRVTASLGWAPSAREWHFDTLFSQADRSLSGQAGGQEPDLSGGLIPRQVMPGRWPLAPTGQRHTESATWSHQI